MKGKRLSLLMTTLSILALVLLLSSSIRHAVADTEYYYDFDTTSTPPTAWTAGADSEVSGEVSTVNSDDNYCPTDGSHYDHLTQGYSSNSTAAVWLVRSFPGDGPSITDTVTLSWDMRDKGADCNSYDPCLTGYYLGTSAPTAQSRFKVFEDDVIDNGDWKGFGPYSNNFNGGTIYVAVMWRHVRGDADDDKPAMGFDCLDVNIHPNS